MNIQMNIQISKQVPLEICGCGCGLLLTRKNIQISAKNIKTRQSRVCSWPQTKPLSRAQMIEVINHINFKRNRALHWNVLDIFDNTMIVVTQKFKKVRTRLGLGISPSNISKVSIASKK